MKREHDIAPLWPPQPADRCQPSAFVDEDRLAARIQAMARIGATPGGGVNRQALTPEDAQAQALLATWGAELGLHPSRDAAGNLFLRMEGSEGGPAVLSGSHLDTQPTGGRYDGTYGVLAALEAVQAIRESGIVPRRPIDVVAWMNEEGSRFAPGMMGSATYAGARTLDEILGVRDASGTSVGQALAETAARLHHIPSRPLGGSAYAYVEAHIEQGPVLERKGIPLGVVTAIQGKHTFRVTVEGEAAHAGTTRRSERRDALLAACAMVNALVAALHDDEDIVKFTVGRFEVTPGAPSVVASRVVFSIDLRHPDSGRLRELSACVQPICASHAGPCGVTVQRLSAADSLAFPESMRQRLHKAADALGIAHLDLPSAAGHDARFLSSVCPSAMLFIPCRAGITHNEAEYASPADMATGARVLANVLAELSLEQA
jgi:amidase, hydantoinase/carbamoylase family